LRKLLKINKIDVSLGKYVLPFLEDMKKLKPSEINTIRIPKGIKVSEELKRDLNIMNIDYLP